MSIGEKKHYHDEDDDQFVSAYLEKHPEFFSRHPEVLEGLRLTHQSGSTISLVERQLSVLRERNSELRNRLSSLMETSRHNDELFANTRKLVLELVEAPTRQATFAALQSSLSNEFKIERHSLILLGSDSAADSASIAESSLEALEKALPSLVRSGSLCGALRPEELGFLFQRGFAATIGSVAAILLTSDRPWAVLALGNADPHHYHGGMDTLFLRYIGDILTRILPGKL